MLKKRWIIVSALVGAIAVLGAGGIVFAQGVKGDGSPGSPLATRVAIILGLEDAVVQDAFDQATEEMYQEVLQARVDLLVEEGQITREQADEYLEWMNNRPEFLDSMPLREHGSSGFHHGRRGHRGDGFGYRFKGWEHRFGSDDGDGESSDDGS